MNLSKIAFIGAASLLALSTAATSSFAETQKEYQSKASITFTVGEGAPQVREPENPEEPFNPQNPYNPKDPVTGDSGPLTLDYVSSLDFGIQTLSLKTEVYESLSMNPFVQVTDRRGGGGLGWQLTAKASPFTNADKTVRLNGAKITFNSGEAVTNNDYGFGHPAAYSEITLTTDDRYISSAVATAETGAGLGSWLIRWLGNKEVKANEKVTLSIPGGVATEDEFTSIITWTLSDTPTN